MSITLDTRQSRETLPTGTWKVDAIHSQVGFAVQYVVGTFRGSFSPVDVSLEVGDDGSATLTGSADVEGVRVQDENLTAHLKSPDFFDAERAPQITFRSSEIERSGDRIAVKGELTIRGATQQVEATGTITDPTEDAHGGVRFGLELETTVDRTKFGIDWNNELPSGGLALANDVTLTAQLFLVKA
jgi:polyisoprenoid-binding protein YceI